MLFSKAVLLVAASVISTSVSASVDIETGCQPELDLSVLTSHQSPPHPVQFRIPPTFTTKLDTKWVPTPAAWFLGTWYFTASNSPIYQMWRNMEWTLSPRPNNTLDHTLNDLTSFQVANKSNDNVYYIYGADYRQTLADGKTVVRDSYNYFPTGPVAAENNTWEVIGWGYDTIGVPWAVLYETKTLDAPSESFDVISRSDKGPEKHTLELIYAAVRGLKNQHLIALMNAAKPLSQDGGRNGSPWPTCNVTCMENAYSAFPL